MKLKKLVAVSLTATLALGVFAGCSNGNNEEKNTSEAPSQAVGNDDTQASGNESSDKTIEACEIEFWHGMSGTQETTLQELTDEFNSSNEYGITVKLVNQGGYTDLSTKLMANAVADTLPDLTQAYNNWLTSYLDKIVPLDSFVENDFDNWDDIIESYRTECSEFGFINAVPFNKSTYLYFYNKTLFDDAGIEVPTTWDEMKEAGQKFMEAYNLPILGVDDLAGFIEATMLQNGTEYIDETGVLFDNEEGLEAITYIMDLYNNGYARLVGEDGYFSYVITNQQIGGYIGSSTGASFITADDWELAVAPLPGNKVQAANQAGTNIVMFTQDENKQLAAWEYLKFLTSVDATTTWAIATGYLPVRYSAYETEEYTEFLATDVTAPAAYAQADYSFAQLNFDNSYDIRNDAGAALQNLILEQADPETAYQTLIDTINADIQ